MEESRGISVPHNTKWRIISAMNEYKDARKQNLFKKFFCLLQYIGASFENRQE